MKNLVCVVSSVGALLVLLTSCNSFVDPSIKDLEVIKLKCDDPLMFCEKVEYKVGESCLIYTQNRHGMVSINSVDFSRVYAKWNAVPRQQPIFNTDFFDGCDWADPIEFIIPDSLKEGLYTWKLEDESGSCTFPIVVHDTIPANVLVLASTNTWQAYNPWGGGSFYKLDSAYKDFGSTSTLVNFRRPNPYALTSSHLVAGELHLLNWMESMNIGFDLCSDREFHNGLDLRQYKVIVLNCHNEYWTDQMVANLETYIQQGGSVFSLGGNQIYARVTYKGDQMEFHEHGGIHVHDGSKGGLWRDLDKPESSLIGVQFDREEYNTYDAFHIIEPDHWLFDGLAVQQGQVFGEHSDNRGKACGHEMDVTTEYSPPSTIILAKGLNNSKLVDGRISYAPGAGEMVVGKYPEGGIFFSVGSITFTGSLPYDSISSGVLLNAFDYIEGKEIR